MQLRRRIGESLIEERQREWRSRRSEMEKGASRREQERDLMLEAMGRQREEVAWAVERIEGVAVYCEGVRGQNETLKGELLAMRLSMEKRGEKKEEEEKVEEEKVEEEEVESVPDEKFGLDSLTSGSSAFVDAYLAGRHIHSYYQPSPIAASSAGDNTYPHAFAYEKKGRDFSGAGVKKVMEGEVGGWSRAMRQAAAVRSGKGATGWHGVARGFLDKGGSWVEKYGRKDIA